MGSGKGRGLSSVFVVCPRCNNKGRLIEKRTPHNIYYYVYHSRNKLCYVGAGRYEYVSKLHDFELRGAHDSKRYIDYLEFIVEILGEALRVVSESIDVLVKRLVEA